MESLNMKLSSFLDESEVPISGQESAPCAQKRSVNFGTETTLNKKYSPVIILAYASTRPYNELRSFLIEKLSRTHDKTSAVPSQQQSSVKLSARTSHKHCCIQECHKQNLDSYLIVLKLSLLLFCRRGPWLQPLLLVVTG
jgi:hypothetical protein